jgi:putative ABC transport system permease protein
MGYDVYASYASIAVMEKNHLLPQRSSDWFEFNAAYTYVLLKENTTKTAFLNRLHAIAGGLNHLNKDGVTSFDMQRLDQITPGTESLANDNSGSSWTKFYFEMAVALLILLAACFNYTNLTIARALTRAKEVGVRKIVGAKRYQVFTQYVVESVLLSLLALVFAWLILAFIIRYAPFNDDYEFIPSAFRYNPTLVLWSLGYALLTGLLAGLAPAWILSAFKPLRVLKSLSTAKILGKISLQKTLIVFQYTLSLTMIIFLFAFYKQFSYLSKLDLGFKRADVLVVSISGLDENIIEQKIASVNGVKTVAASSAHFEKHFSGLNAPVWKDNKKEALSLNYYYTDQNFIPSMQFKLIAGTNFPGESNDEQYIIVNEKAIHALGFSDSYKALGQKLWIDDSTQLQITGVLKDFQYENAGKPIAPLAFRNKKKAYGYLYVTTDHADKRVLTRDIEHALRELQPSQPLQFSWLDETLEKNNAQTATISLLGFLVFIAIAIASLGLLGLVVYTVEVKRKEISIRKIVGAEKKQLISMLSNGFIKLLLVAGLIATPIGYLAGSFFLQNFAQRTHFGVLNIAACFLFVFAIGLVTIISQTYKAAMINPAKTLRTE